MQANNSKSLIAKCSSPLFVLIGSAVIFLTLGFWQDGINVDSATYSVVARNMAETCEWLNPTYTAYVHSQFAEHPPLFFWLQSIVFMILGAADSTARIIGALCALGSIIAVYKIGKEVYDKHFGFLSGLILLLTYNFMSIGNSALLDVPMIAFILFGLLYFIKAMKSESNRLYFFISGLLLGCAFLIKGVVSVPVWGALALSLIIIDRKCLMTSRPYFLPLGAIIVIGSYLLIDYFSTGGHFSQYYFGTHVIRSLKGTNVVVKPEWYKFTLKYMSLYLPFIILIPFGLYMTIKNRVRFLLPIVLSLAIYIVFHSIADKLFYHYFISTYAFSAPIAALPLYFMFKPRIIEKIRLIFSIVWVVLAVLVISVNIRIHQIRSPEIYNNKEIMTGYLDEEKLRDGLIVSDGAPNWDYVAKTSWYWRSDMKILPTLDEAIVLLKAENQFRYILATPDYFLSDSLLSSLKLNRLIADKSIELYINQ